jgi:hypothetical protein
MGKKITDTVNVRNVFKRDNFSQNICFSMSGLIFERKHKTNVCIKEETHVTINR